MNADTVGFSSTRRKKRAARGYVSNIVVAPADGVNARRTRREFARDVKRRSLVRMLAVAVICVALVFGVAGLAGMTAFYASLDSKMGLPSDDAARALVAPAKDAEGYYVLVAADLDSGDAPSLGDGSDAFALVRICEGKREVGVVSLPANTTVTGSDGKTHQLREVAALGDADLITAVANFAGVSIAHYVTTDASGIINLTDLLGGVTMNLEEEIDDPAAGDKYIPAGEQHIGKDQALTLLRASNLSGGIDLQMKNQREFMVALAIQAMSDSTWSFLLGLDSLNGAFATDVSAKDAAHIASALRGIDAASVQGAIVPGYEREIDGNVLYVASSSDASELIGRLEAGDTLVNEDSAPVNVDPGSFTITVRNGAGVTGGAAEISKALANYGYNVTETGNTDTYAYKETLVIYLDEAYADAAESVVQSLGMGRVVDGTGFYEFNTDVLVVLGSDWAPVS
ncbi:MULTISPECIES: LCP family protein [unclassified Adlercreutzia]|uniref:LCP family protein n=1 Tax=unclassified Adlercreutzia TaxID=2636013 RepID=UPI001F14A9B4|nr:MULTISPECIES: LCP family protein [unclassified Adlercreutzia]